MAVDPPDSYWGTDKPKPSCHGYLVMTATLLLKACFYPNTFFSFSFIFMFQQPNFKQKFVALLKRFKVTDEVSYDWAFKRSRLVECQKNCDGLYRARPLTQHCLEPLLPSVITSSSASALIHNTY